MQGTLNEIDIRSILQLIELGQRTGELFIEGYGPTAVRGKNREQIPLTPQFWFIFCINGQIAYATDHTSQNFLRLRDYLRPHGAQSALDELISTKTVTSSTPEYTYIWRLLEKNILTPAEGRKIIQSMIEETLFDLFNLHQGEFIFEIAPPLAPQLNTSSITPLIAKTMRQVQQWKQFYPHIQDPDQYFLFVNESELQASLPKRPYQSLASWASHKVSLRQLSRYLQRDVVTFGKGLYPYAERGWLQFEHLISKQPESSISIPPERATLPYVVCIDDDLVMGKNIQFLLEQHKYPASIFTNPLEALSQVFQLQPDIILCDIVMPQLDGYELCAMLRHSTAFRQTPIIMLTGKESFIDRVRARIVGATDYLTKPFGVGELLLLLEKYGNH